MCEAVKGLCAASWCRRADRMSVEKDEVFRLLATELPWSVDWLYFLDAERALPIVKQEEEKGRGDPYGETCKLQAAIVASGALVWLARHPR